ncbi:phospholipase D-like domain-containing protein [Candidatus Palauibacter sp.]|uniref:phospholipase D-like domain-containing protein n=1 Tax=Candidatus Palauibacter sp. TaxID=3101350 RepID=UPI003B594884
MIIKPGEFNRKLATMLKSATHVDIATAWTTGGEHLRLLESAAGRNVKIRAIVGISGNATHPDALDELFEIGHLRIVRDEGRLFHPKVYVFHYGERRVAGRAWIGSANFTDGGFWRNEEVMLELGGEKEFEELASWFEDRWNQCSTQTPVSAEIKRYRERWKRNPPRRGIMRLASGVSTRVELLRESQPPNFEAYFDALKTCDQMLATRGWRVFSRKGYVRALTERRKLLSCPPPWRELPPHRLEALKGSTRARAGAWWGLGGRMSRNWYAVEKHEMAIRDILKRVRDASPEDFPAIGVWGLDEIRGLGKGLRRGGTATLLLMLTRPDRLLSVNGESTPGAEQGSVRGLATLSGLAPTTLRKPAKYGKLLEWLYDQPWYADEEPVADDLKEAWGLRAGLLDAFVYVGTE